MRLRSQRLKSVVADYDNKPILYFLRAIGHNIQLQFYDVLVCFFRAVWLLNVIIIHSFFVV